MSAAASAVASLERHLERIADRKRQLVGRATIRQRVVDDHLAWLVSQDDQMATLDVEIEDLESRLPALAAVADAEVQQVARDAAQAELDLLEAEDAEAQAKIARAAELRRALDGGAE